MRKASKKVAPIKITLKGRARKKDKMGEEYPKRLSSAQIVTINGIPATIKVILWRVRITLKIEGVNLDENPIVFIVGLL
jgi:hypothetical protein